MKIGKYENSKGEIWLNVASSFYVLKDFINLDNHIFLHFKGFLPVLKRLVPSKYYNLIDNYIDASKKAVIVKHDCRKALRFPANSVDHILCSHFLEHVYIDETDSILRDFYRVLKPGATIHIIVPDLEVDITSYLKQKEKGVITAADTFLRRTLLSRTSRGSLKYRFLELHGGFGLQHRWMFDHESMEMRIKECGFQILEKNETPSKAFRSNDDSVHIVGIK